jgi:hypothetical protein
LEHKQIIFRFIATAVVAGIAASISVAAQQYAIKLNPSEEAGLSYHFAASSTQTTVAEATLAGQLLNHNTNTVTVRLTANVTVIDAAQGWATRKQFKVLNSEVVRDGHTVLILPNGTEVVASIRNGETIYEVNGRAVGEETATALRAVISLHVSSVADDDMFGTPVPQKIGASWTPNPAQMKKLLKEMGAQGGRQEITAKSTLEKVMDNHLFVRGSITVKDVLLKASPGLTAEGGEIQTELWGRFPIRRNDISKEANGRMRISSSSSGLNPDGQKVTVQVVYESISRYEISPIR